MKLPFYDVCQNSANCYYVRDRIQLLLISRNKSLHCCNKDRVRPALIDLFWRLCLKTAQIDDSSEHLSCLAQGLERIGNGQRTVAVSAILRFELFAAPDGRVRNLPTIKIGGYTDRQVADQCTFID